MKVNPVPFMVLAVLAPGAYAYDGLDVTCKVCSTWCIVVVFGTAVHMTRVIRHERRARNDRRRKQRAADIRFDIDRFIDRVTSVVAERR